MASGPITPLQIDGGKWKQWQSFFSWASKSLQMATVAMTIKRCLLLGRKTMTNLDRVLKAETSLCWQRSVQSKLFFSSIMYGCENWTIKKSESQRTDAYKLWCWRRLLRIRWTARRSNQSILKEISPEYSLEGLILKLKLQSSGHLIWKADSFEKILMLGKIQGRRRRGQQRMRWLNGIVDSMGMSLRKLGTSEGQGSLAAAVRGVTKSWTSVSDWRTQPL